MGTGARAKHKFGPNKTVNTQKGQVKLATHVPAIILFPALLTPAILTGDQSLEILLLGKTRAQGQSITEQNVSNQLKIAKGLNSRKVYETDILPSDLVTLTGWGKLNNEIIKTISQNEEGKSAEGQIRGLLDKRALNLFKKYGYGDYYSFQIRNENLFKADDGSTPPRGLYNLIWVCDSEKMSEKDKESPIDWNPDEITWPGQEDASSRFRQLNIITVGRKIKVTGNEIHDRLIRIGVLDRLNGKNITERGRYCFDDGDPTFDIDTEDPIQSYHPVFYYKNLTYANIAHMSDVHLCARQHVMARSEARVIECSIDELDEKISPKLSDIVNINLFNFRELLKKVGRDEEIHLLLISGDLVDYVKSLYVRKQLSSGNARSCEHAPDIWDLVKLDGDYKKRYQDYVDYISLYSLLVSFCRSWKKPVFAVNGNHDPYYWPYGVSPRVPIKGRANEGIPADHNLTIYEAILLFGETYYKVIKGLNLDPDALEWFYSVFTPFSDFAIHLPNQCIVGLAWGDDEDILRDLGIGGGDIAQGFWGHLPRASKAINDQQMRFFDAMQNAKGERKVIMTTHFTFISYAADIPSHLLHQGSIELNNYGKYDMGSFEKNRKKFYAEHLDKQKPTCVQCILTGHSHRRGLYAIESVSDGTVKTKIYDFSQFNDIRPSSRQPSIIVSDPAGPLPRINKTGRLAGWGSDRPSSTKIVFNKNDGSISSIKPIQVDSNRAKPRFAVAIDYYDIFVGGARARARPAHASKARILDTLYFTVDLNRNDMRARMDLHPDVVKLASVESVFLYSHYSRTWHRLKVKYDPHTSYVSISDIATFREWFAPRKAKVFLAIKFKMKERMKRILGQYNFDHYWCFPVKVREFLDLVRTQRKIYYHITRWQYSQHEIPDFQWLKEYYAKTHK